MILVTGWGCIDIQLKGSEDVQYNKGQVKLYEPINE